MAEGITFRTQVLVVLVGRVVEAFLRRNLTITFEADSAALMAMEMISRGIRGVKLLPMLT